MRRVRTGLRRRDGIGMARRWAEEEPGTGWDGLDAAGFHVKRGLRAPGDAAFHVERGLWNRRRPFHVKPAVPR